MKDEVKIWLDSRINLIINKISIRIQTKFRSYKKRNYLKKLRIHSNVIGKIFRGYTLRERYILLLSKI